MVDLLHCTDAIGRILDEGGVRGYPDHKHSASRGVQRDMPLVFVQARAPRPAAPPRQWVPRASRARCQPSACAAHHSCLSAGRRPAARRTHTAGARSRTPASPLPTRPAPRAPRHPRSCAPASAPAAPASAPTPCGSRRPSLTPRAAAPAASGCAGRCAARSSGAARATRLPPSI
ncbi:MAG: hypothetical protein J3K34DRAFT_56047 [Monoraphidium minutum]|nr:MAG: hypothetical protein J3K34DRAFT_56047 [Monoraphidium minutum]